MIPQYSFKVSLKNRVFFLNKSKSGLGWNYRYLKLCLISFCLLCFNLLKDIITEHGHNTCISSDLKLKYWYRYIKMIADVNETEMTFHKITNFVCNLCCNIIHRFAVFPIKDIDCTEFFFFGLYTQKRLIPINCNYW